MMTAGVFVKLPRRVWSIASAVSIGLALIALFLVKDVTYDPYAGVASNDALAFYARLVFGLTGLILLGMAHDQVDEARASEFFGSILMIHAGAMLVSTANELVFLFVGLELVSIPTYLLLYLARRTASTQEAATKYFFLSIFSSALLLFGMAYLYGLTGVSNLKALAFLMRLPGVRTGPVRPDRGRLPDGGAGLPGRGGAVPLLRARRLSRFPGDPRRAARLGAEGAGFRGHLQGSGGGGLRGGAVESLQPARGPARGGPRRRDDDAG